MRLQKRSSSGLSSATATQENKLFLTAKKYSEQVGARKLYAGYEGFYCILVFIV